MKVRSTPQSARNLRMSSTSEEFIQIAKPSSETPPNQWILPWEHCVPSEKQAELRISIEALFLGNAGVRLGEVSTLVLPLNTLR